MDSTDHFFLGRLHSITCSGDTTGLIWVSLTLLYNWHSLSIEVNTDRSLNFVVYCKCFSSHLIFINCLSCLSHTLEFHLDTLYVFYLRRPNHTSPPCVRGDVAIILHNFTEDSFQHCLQKVPALYHALHWRPSFNR